MRWAVAVAVLVCGVSHATTYYVSSSSSTTSSCDAYGTPCKPSAVWAYVSGDDTVIYLDGTYTGADYMIDPGVSGTSGHPITISCENDGGCYIDGENARIPIELSGEAYIDIDGFDAARSSSTTCKALSGDHINWRRMVCSDAEDGKGDIFVPGNNSLVEDCATFGVGRKHYSVYGQENVTLRRVWGRWEGAQYTGPRLVGEMFYLSTNVRIENAIYTWDAGSMFSPWYIAGPSGSDYVPIDGPHTDWGSNGYKGNPRGGLAVGQVTTLGDDVDANAYGVIVYVPDNGLSFDTFPISRGAVDFSAGSTALACDMEVDNLAVYIDPAVVTENGGPSYQIYLREVDGCATPNTMSNVSSVGTSGNRDYTGGDSNIEDMTDWVVTDLDTQTSVASLTDTIYEGTGAVICKRYESGALTDTPLWPWPMQGRIYDATTRAADAGHTHLMLDCSSNPCGTDSKNDPHAVADVTGDIVSIFGAPPQACKRGGNVVVN